MNKHRKHKYRTILSLNSLIPVILLIALTIGLCSCGGGGSGSGSDGSKSSPGQILSGTGDTKNYFPFAQGNTWRFQGTLTKTGSATPDSDYSSDWILEGAFLKTALTPGNFFNTVKVTGTKLINGITATVWTESNTDNSGEPAEIYYQKDSEGITNYGNNDSTDTVTPQLIPYKEVTFPLQTNTSFIQINMTG